MPRIFWEASDERVDYAEDLAQTSTEIFDRLAFAARALALVRPRATRVAIREGRRRVHLEGGRQWGRSEGSRWAILSVPHNASRRAIATAVLSLAGRDARPYALDVLLRDGRSSEDA